MKKLFFFSIFFINISHANLPSKNNTIFSIFETEEFKSLSDPEEIRKNNLSQCLNNAQKTLSSKYNSCSKKRSKISCGNKANAKFKSEINKCAQGAYQAWKKKVKVSLKRKFK